MTDKITYYAIIDQFSSRERPAGVLRRVENDEGEVDEAFSRNLKWEFSPLLYSAERGDLGNDFVPIGDGKYLLPVHSEALSCRRGTGECTRNVIDFRNYKKFGAETNITFGSDK